MKIVNQNYHPTFYMYSKIWFCLFVLFLHSPWPPSQVPKWKFQEETSQLPSTKYTSIIEADLFWKRGSLTTPVPIIQYVGMFMPIRAYL